MLESYRKHVSERAEDGLPPLPLNAEQVAGIVELLKTPPAGEADFLVDLLVNRVPPGVDEAAYVKAGFFGRGGQGRSGFPAHRPDTCHGATGHHARRLQHRNLGGAAG